MKIKHKQMLQKSFNITSLDNVLTVILIKDYCINRMNVGLSKIFTFYNLLNNASQVSLSTHCQEM